MNIIDTFFPSFGELSYELSKYLDKNINIGDRCEGGCQF